uniref:Putative secreted protein n=1 Tax=Amblyomma cajennense TaxID=34607 RepID=A0A023FBN8_AMBCJ
MIMLTYRARQCIELAFMTCCCGGPTDRSSPLYTVGRARLKIEGTLCPHHCCIAIVVHYSGPLTSSYALLWHHEICDTTYS